MAYEDSNEQQDQPSIQAQPVEAQKRATQQDLPREGGGFFWRGTPSDYPETNSYEYSRVRYIDSAGL